MGSNSLEESDSNRKTVASSHYEIHPDFNPETLENDVGLIKLREPLLYNGKIKFKKLTCLYVIFADYIQRILLAYDFTDDKTVLTATGWGQTSDCKFFKLYIYILLLFDLF